MAAVKSNMISLGTKAKPFKLPSSSGEVIELNKFVVNAKGVVILFICNHCPYVKHLNQQLVVTANEYITKGIVFLAINSNDVVKYPADSQENMRKVIEDENYPFPYLFDETQNIAKAYQAACTPDFYLFDATLSLVYRGQFDSSRPGNGNSVTGNDLKLAMNNLLEMKPPIINQIPSIGCNIKWKTGNEPDYYLKR